MNRLTSALRHPKEQLKHQQEKLQQLAKRLHNSQEQQLKHCSTQLTAFNDRLWRAAPNKTVQQQQEKLTALQQALARGITQQLQQQRQTLAQLGQQLQIVSPLATLSRGYAIVQDDEQKIIRHYQQVKLGDTINIRLAEGELIGQVKAQKP